MKYVIKVKYEDNYVGDMHCRDAFEAIETVISKLRDMENKFFDIHIVSMIIEKEI